ncbi:MAG: hypothetical protein WBA72_10650 [Ornithinimicrobium sp.]
MAALLDAGARGLSENRSHLTVVVSFSDPCQQRTQDAQLWAQTVAIAHVNAGLVEPLVRAGKRRVQFFNQVVHSHLGMLTTPTFMAGDVSVLRPKQVIYALQAISIVKDGV